MKIAVVYSTASVRMAKSKYGETDNDSQQIARMVVKGLDFLGHDAFLIEISEYDIEKIAKIKAECIFNLIEWCGADIELAKKSFLYLRKLNLPVTGSSEKVFCLTGDEILLKSELLKNNILCPKGVGFESSNEIFNTDFAYPVIVKPSLEHCSIGLGKKSIARNIFELKKIVESQVKIFNQAVLVEEFVEGREFLIYLVEVMGEIKVLPIEEVIFLGNNENSFQTYESKWVADHPDYNSTDIVLAQLSKEETRKIGKIAKKCFLDIGLFGYGRIDARYRDGELYILEVNANSSVYDAEQELVDINSEVIWGIKFPTYLDNIVKAAVTHFEKGDIM